MQDLITTRKFFESVVSSDFEHRRVTIAMKPTEYDSYDTDFLFSRENGTLEIMVLKKTIKAITQETHPILEEYLSDGQVIPDENSLIKLFFVTVGMMLVTHEHHTVINIHEEIVFKILFCRLPVYTDLLLDTKKFIYKELFLIQSLLTSNNNKLNKSSSLWHLFKKLFIHTQDNITPDIDSAFFFNTAIKAAELHPSNYYSWSFVTFLLNILKLNGKTKIVGEYTEQIQKFCYSHQRDDAAWNCFTESLCLSASGLKQAAYEYNRYAKKSTVEYNSQRLVLLFPSATQKLMDLSKWLWDNRISTDAPFHAFQKLSFYCVKNWGESNLVKEMFKQIAIHVSLFESLKLIPEKITMTFKNGYFLTSADLTSDLELCELLSNYYNLKRLLNYFDTFLKNDYIPHTP